LTSPVRAEVRGAITDPLGKLGWQGELSWPAMDLHALRATWPVLSVAGKVHGSGDLEHVQAEGELHSVYENLHADHRFLIDYDHDRGMIDVRRLISTLRETGTALAVHGTLSRLGQVPQAEFTGTWQNLRWPLQGAETVHSNSGTFSVSGSLDDYQLRLAGDAVGTHVPGATWSIDAAGQAQGLTVNRADAHLLGGDIGVSGHIDWRAAPRWQLSIQGEGLDPGKQWPKWPGRLSLAAQVDGDMTDDTLRTQVALTRLHGELKSIPLDADAVLSVQGDQWRLGKLRIDSGGNRLTAAGTLRDEWNMEWQVNAANLAHLLPGGGGRLRGSGYVTGARLHPIFTASLSGQQVSFAADRIGALSLVMAVDTQGHIPSTVEIEAQDAAFGDRHIDGIRVHGDGTAQHHQAQLFVTTPAAKLALVFNGEYAHEAWKGSLERLDLDTAAAGHWRLAAPAALSFAKAAARLQEFCLQQDHARLCAAAHMNAADDWQLTADAHDVPLSLFEEWLPTGTSLTGKLDGRGRLGATPAAPLNGEMEITLQAGVVSPPVPGMPKSTTPIAYHGGQLKATLDAGALSANLRIDLADGGNVRGELRVEREALPAPLGGGQTARDGALVGQLLGDIRDLSLLPAFIPGIEHTQGRLSSTLSIAGSWDRPRVIGELRLENGALAIPSLGLNPDNIDVVVRGDETGRLRVDAQLRSKDGNLRLGGDVRYSRPQGWDIQAQLNGESAEIVNTPEYHILASPDMHLSVKGHRIDMNGELLIPEANLRPRDVTGAVSASDDVVIVGVEGAAPPQERWQIYTNLRIRLGKFVKFTGYGLRGLLNGDFTLSDEPQKPTMARGELSIVNGEYRAYGQKLTIDRGRLLFFGGPVDNPGLDIRAVRQIRTPTTVTAGILVRGTLKAPQVQLFSEPAMAETDALSYLLTGQPMNQASGTQGQQLYGAALSLGLAGSGLLASQIGQRFGIDQVTVESGGSFGTGALVIRHYLSPKLYISYGVGLMERLNIFLMRYQISRIWALEAESGSQSGADLVYTLEKK
jgi:translocation and assembly module TamB